MHGPRQEETGDGEKAITSVMSIIDMVERGYLRTSLLLTLDVGTDGWSRLQSPDCNKSTGVDGSYEMIAKARKTNPKEITCLLDFRIGPLIPMTLQ